MSGPLTGTKVVELGSIGPAPFCGMLLADMGAEIVRIDRVNPPPDLWSPPDPGGELLNRGRRSIGLDLRSVAGQDVARRLIDRADVLIEGLRPGVVERLGLGPAECRERNPGLVFGRMTGWGQEGPYSAEAGHDINYLAVSGTLALIGRRGEAPLQPINLLGDFGGGGMLLAVGVLAALLERGRSGAGQVVDAAMVDGAALLGTMFHGYLQAGVHRGERGTNIGDSGSPFYNVYATADDRYVAVGAIEPQFYAALLEVMELDPDELPDQMDRERWPQMKETFAARFLTRSRDDWTRRAAGRNACLSPVLEFAEVDQDPHLRARGTFVERGGYRQPAPAPRFDRTPGEIQGDAPAAGADTAALLAEAGYSEAEVAALREAGAVGFAAD
jgi:alpha-methylacyl-CoA racemase